MHQRCKQKAEEEESINSHRLANILPIWVYSVAQVMVATGKMSVKGRISFQNCKRDKLLSGDSSIII